MDDEDRATTLPLPPSPSFHDDEDQAYLSPAPSTSWSDNSSVTSSDEDSPSESDAPVKNQKKKKNIHARRWTLIHTPDEEVNFTILGGRRKVEITNLSKSWFLEGNQDLAEADFLLPRLSLSRPPGRNGHIRPGVGFEGYINRTLETMREEFLTYQALWLKSSTYTSVKSTMARLKEGQVSRVAVDSVVCLALGSPQNTKEVCRAASLTQLAALLTIIEELGLDPLTAPPGKFTAQDPAFTPLDATFLSTLGITVKADPEGFLAITENTLVYSIAGYLDMDWVISQGPWPAAMVCGDVEGFIRGNEESAREARRAMARGEGKTRISCPTRREVEEILEMLGGCDLVDLVGKEGSALAGWDAIGHQKVYWRRKVGE